MAFKYKIIDPKTFTCVSVADETKTYEIKAGGVLFYYRVYDDQKKHIKSEILLIENRGALEDFGGKRNFANPMIKHANPDGSLTGQVADKDVYEMVSREVDEESNGYYKREDIYKKIKGQGMIYITQSKYVIFLIELEDRVDCAIFGDREKKDDIPRKMKWIDAKFFATMKRNFRLNNIEINEFMRSLNPNKIVDIVDDDVLQAYELVKKRIQSDEPEIQGELLLTRYFKGIPYEIAKRILRRYFNVHMRYTGNLLSVCYNDSYEIWHNTEEIPTMIKFLSQNRGTIYEYKHESETGETVYNYDVVALPFTKFWQHDEKLSEHGRLIWNKNTRVTEKYDGHIIKVYYYKRDKKWYVSTNSYVDCSEKVLRNSDMSADQAFKECATASKFDYEKLNKNSVYLFELLHPRCRICIPYDKPQLIHIGTRDMLTLKEIDEDIGLTKPLVYDIKSYAEAVKIANTFVDKEGFVVTDENGCRVKIKSIHYSNYHKLMELGEKNKDHSIRLFMTFAWRMNTIETTTKMYPEFADKFNEMEAGLRSIYDQTLKVYMTLDTSNNKNFYSGLTQCDQSIQPVLRYLYNKNLKTISYDEYMRLIRDEKIINKKNFMENYLKVTLE